MPEIRFATSWWEIGLWLLFGPFFILGAIRTLRGLARQHQLGFVSATVMGGLVLRLLVPFGPQNWYFGMLNAIPTPPGILASSFQPLPNRLISFTLGGGIDGLRAWNLFAGTAAIFVLGGAILGTEIPVRAGRIFTVLLAVSPLHVVYASNDGAHTTLLLLFACSVAAYVRLSTAGGDTMDAALLALGVFLACPIRVESTLQLMSMPFLLFHAGRSALSIARSRATLTMGLAGAAGAVWMLMLRAGQLASHGSLRWGEALVTLIRDTLFLTDPLPISWIPPILAVPVWIEMRRHFKDRNGREIAALCLPVLFCAIPECWGPAAIVVSLPQLGYYILNSLFVLLAAARCLDAIWERYLRGEFLRTSRRKLLFRTAIVPVFLLSFIAPLFFHEPFQDEFRALRRILPQGHATILTLADKNQSDGDYDCCLYEPYPLFRPERHGLKWIVLTQDALSSGAWKDLPFDYYYPGTLPSLPEDGAHAGIENKLNKAGMQGLTDMNPKDQQRLVSLRSLKALDREIHAAYDLEPVAQTSRPVAEAEFVPALFKRRTGSVLTKAN